MTMPSLPIETIETIIFFLPQENKEELARYSLVSRAFHAAAEKFLYRVVIADVYDEAVPLLQKTVELNPSLGRAMKALRFRNEVGQGSADGGYEFNLLEGLARACKESLVELSVERATLNRVADLLAWPHALRLVNFVDCSILEPATSHVSIVPSNSIKYLALDGSYFTCDTLPPQAFPHLVTVSVSELESEDWEQFYEANRFILALPPTLKALRMHFSSSWEIYMDDEDTSDGSSEKSLKPTCEEWRQALLRWTSLQVLEVDLNNFYPEDGENEDEELKGGVLSFLNSGTNFIALKLFVCLLDRDWSGKLNDLVKNISIAPPCFATIEKLTVSHVDYSFPPLEDGITQKDSSSNFWLKGENRRGVLEFCKENGVDLKYQRGYWKDLTSTDPFWGNLMEESRFINKFDGSL